MIMMMMMKGMMEKVEWMKPVVVMVMVQTTYAVVNVLYKLAAADGLSLRILVAYRFIFASAFILPLALYFERKDRPKLTCTILFQAFLCGLFSGSLSQNMFLESIVLTSATFATAMFNLVPAATFILAISFRIEKVGIRTRGGKAKLMGTVMGIGGAMLLTLYKGSQITLWTTHVNLLRHYQSHQQLLVSSHPNHASYLLGCFLAIANCFAYSLWLIIQAKMSRRYPCAYSSTALTSLMASIQAAVYAMCMEKDWNQWKLGWSIRLLTAAFAGIVVAGMMTTMVIWCVRTRGPVFVSVFNPLLLVLTALAGSLLLDETLHLGSILGATVMICGLYAVVWGKNAEMVESTKTYHQSKAIEEVIVSSPKNDTPTHQSCS